MKRLLPILLVSLFLAGCASSQFASFRPSSSDKNFAVDVVRSGLSGKTFTVSINNVKVIKKTWPVIVVGHVLEGEGTFEGAKVRMVGKYKVGFPCKYVIEVFIDNEKAAQFQFNISMFSMS